MKDIMNIDWNEPYAKRVAADPTKQKVFFIQNGIEYDAAGKACNKTQVNNYYKKLQKDAEEQVAAAKAALDAAKENAAAVKSAGK